MTMEARANLKSVDLPNRSEHLAKSSRVKPHGCEVEFLPSAFRFHESSGQGWISLLLAPLDHGEQFRL